eukprot:1136362-Pelagomonas_calceolata.AAC.2
MQQDRDPRCPARPHASPCWAKQGGAYGVLLRVLQTTRRRVRVCASTVHIYTTTEVNLTRTHTHTCTHRACAPVHTQPLRSDRAAVQDGAYKL